METHGDGTWNSLTFRPTDARLEWGRTDGEGLGIGVVTED